ncbi:MAG: hypothetical protein RLZZ455_551 [Candidatus Parcubacteria bacterium]|jgi:hypothetical protein
MLHLFLPVVLFVATQISIHSQPQIEPVLATRTISLEKRYPNPFVNTVFKENILLNLAYMRGIVSPSKNVDWVKVTEPFTYTLILQPGEVFAFQEDVLPEYRDSLAKTTNAHFNAQEGFKSDGYLMGDGVCHLASLIYWAAADAKLHAKAPTNHNFAHIPEVPKEYGVSIYYAPGNETGNARQNLYVKNDKTIPIAFVFSYKDDLLRVDVKEELKKPS